MARLEGLDSASLRGQNIVPQGNPMTRPWLAALSLSVSLLAQAAAQSGATDASHEAFLRHQPGQPTISGETFRTAREVQEGCELPCLSSDETSAYLKKIETAAAQLGLSASETAQAEENYAPHGVPRKKGSPAARGAAAAAEAKLHPGLNARLDARTRELAASLGSSRFLAAEDVSGRAVPAQPGINPSAPAPGARAKDVKVPAPALDPGQVEQRFTEAIDAQISHYPTGERLLSSMSNPPSVMLEKSDRPSFNAGHVKGSPDEITINTVRCAEALQRLDPAGSRGLELADPAKLRRYLAGHPEMIGTLAEEFDVVYVHELTHAAQYRREGTGWLNDKVNTWIELLNGRRYPVEKEWEAYGTQNQYLLEKARRDPAILRLNGPASDVVREFIDYSEDLKQYRKEKASISYDQDTASLDHLRLHGADEKAYYRAALGQEEVEWPQRSVEGLLLLSRSANLRLYPLDSLAYLKTAFDRAAAGGFLASWRPEMTEVFKASLAGIEARLALAEKQKDRWSLGQKSRTLILQLDADLRLPLPPRLAKAVDQE
jgi:hypothetical protein